MEELENKNDYSLNTFGTIGSILDGYLDTYLKKEEIKVINNKLDILNKKLEDFDIFKYKIVNRYKIRNLIVKVLSEEKDDFIEIAVSLLKQSEDNFENIIDGIMKLTSKDIEVLYNNLWKKRGDKKYDVNNLKQEIGNNYEFVPDLIMNFEYRVNKNDFISNENSLMVGESLTLMPNLESSNIFNIFEKLSYNNFIKISKYIPNKNTDSFNTYLCFTFTYIGIYLCKIMEEIEKRRRDK